MKRVYKTAMLILTLAALLLASVSCSAIPEEGTPEGMKSATAAGDEFRLYVPSVWTVNTAYGVSGAYFTMSEPSNVSAVKYEITQDMSAAMEAAGVADGARLDWFWENNCLPAVEQVSLGGSLQKVEQEEKEEDGTEGDETEGGEKNESLLLGECNARRYHVTATVRGETLHFTHVIAERGGAFFVLTFTVTDDLHEALLDNVEAIIAAFVFAEPYDPDEFVKLPAEGVDAPEGMKLASNDQVPYRFFVPADWTLNNLEQVYAAYVESDRSSVCVTPYMPETEMRVGEFFELCAEMLENSADKDGYELLETKTDVDMGGEVATAYTYRYTVGGREVRCMQVIAAHGSMIYSVTYTATPACFDAHLDEVERIIDAFAFR